MRNDYWFIRDPFSRQVRIRFLNDAYQNLDTFLSISNSGALEDALEVLAEDPNATYRDYPGDYLTLRAENGWVTAKINLFGDRADARLPAELFARVSSEYLQEVERLRGEW